MQAIDQKPDHESLFRDAVDDLTRYFARLHANGGEAPQDLVPETFLEMARGLERGGKPRSLRGYLFGIARHVGHAAWKRKDQEGGHRSDLAPEPTGTTASDARVEAARKVIGSLPVAVALPGAPKS